MAVDQNGNPINKTWNGPQFVTNGQQLYTQGNAPAGGGNPAAGNTQAYLPNTDIYQQMMKSIVGQGKPGGGKWSNQDFQSLMNQYGSTFANNFQNAVGRAPTADEINQYFQNVVEPIGGSAGGFSAADNFGAANQAAQSYIPTTFGSQIQQNNQNQIQSQIGQLQNDMNQARQAGLDYYTKGPGMDQLKQSLNQGGMLDSGAFADQLAKQLAGQEAGIQSNAIQNFVLPGVSGNQNPSFQSQLGQASGINNQTNQSMQGYLNYLMQGDAANQLAGQMQPSFGQTYMAPVLQGASQGLAQKGTSYICLEMIDRGILKEKDLDDLHYHVMPAVLKKGRAFWHYARYGQQLVSEANVKCPSWAWKMKPLFFDRVMEEKDPIKAVQLYAEAFKILCMAVNPSLWNEKALRISYFDSIPFIPRLVFYKPYRRTLAKVLKMRMFQMEEQYGS